MHQFPITGVAFLLILGDKMNCEVGFAICFLRAYTCHAAQFPESMYVPALLPCYLIVGLLTPMGLRALTIACRTPTTTTFISSSLNLQIA